MKAILEFNLDNQDDVTAHKRAVKSLDMALTLWDMDQYLRGRIKHGDEEPVVYEALQQIRNKLYACMSEHSIDIDELLN